MKALKILKKVLIYFPKCPKSMNYIPPPALMAFLKNIYPCTLNSYIFNSVYNMWYTFTLYCFFNKFPWLYIFIKFYF